MNVLILTGKFGMGHYSVSDALKDEILSKDLDAYVKVIDIIEYLFPSYSKKIYEGFNIFVQYFSFVYNILNKIAGRFGIAPFKDKVIKDIEKLLNYYKADLVITTLPLCAQYVSSFKEVSGSNIPLYTYITDITIHDEWIAKNTDLYFVGGECTKNNLIKKGVSAENIIVSGIPVRHRFKFNNIRDEFKEKKEILIMGGGLGLIPEINELLSNICRNNNTHITMITGHNKKLMKDTKKRFPQVDVIGYTTNVDYYMRKADLIVTKSGGITTFEAINIGTPLYILKPFLVQEIGNAKYIEKNNIGRIMWSKKINIADDIISLLENKLVLKSMRSNMKNLQKKWDTTYSLSYFDKSGEII